MAGFRSEYGEHEALIEIQSLAVYAGSLLSRALALVREWATLHRDESRQDWTLARAGRVPGAIAPLEWNSSMGLVRISSVTPLDGFHLRLVLTDGSVTERDVEPLLVGPVFEAVRDNPDVFRAAKAACGTVVWPNGADLCPDILIWGGPPREGSVPNKLFLATHAS